MEPGSRRRQAQLAPMAITFLNGFSAMPLAA